MLVKVPISREIHVCVFKNSHVNLSSPAWMLLFLVSKPVRHSADDRFFVFLSEISLSFLTRSTVTAMSSTPVGTRASNWKLRRRAAGDTVSEPKCLYSLAVSYRKVESLIHRTWLWLRIYSRDESRGSKAFIRVCVWFCLSICTIEPKLLKLQSPDLPQG